MKYKVYPKYKDSGIEWLGQIPEHWQLRKIKYCTRSITNGTTSTQVNYRTPYKVTRIETISFGKVDYNKIGYIEASPTLSKFLLQKYDILLSHINSLHMIGNNAIFLAEEELYHGMNLLRIQTQENIHPFYLLWWLKSKSFICSIRLVSKQAINQVSVPILKLKDIVFAVSELNEQKEIADFLNKETSQINSLVQKKERQIELLKEKRSALITHAVTKGLNHNVKMKNSGIEWLGQIPEHWQLRKIKYLAKSNPSNVDKKIKDNEKEVFLCNYVDVYKNDCITSGINFMKATATVEQIYKFILRKGDVIVTKDSEVRNDIAVPALVIEDFDNVVCGYHLTHIKPKKILGAYLFRCFQSKWIQSYCENVANGITRYGIGVDKFNSVLIVFPSVSEQKEITNFLDKETAKIDSLIEKITNSIELLKEYRSALITSAVTGQIDVRQTQRNLTVAKVATVQKEASPLFKKVVLGAEIVSQMQNDSHFGRTKFMKTLYLCEAHLQMPLQGEYKREAAGPLDNSIYKIEGIMNKQKWFKTVKTGSMYKYCSLQNPSGYKKYFNNYWNEYQDKLNNLLSFVKQWTTEQSEIIDTVFAVWNDLLIEDKKPSDKQIIYEVKNNWHHKKKRFSDDRLRKAIKWMKENNLVPKGYGPKTQLAKRIKT